MSASIHPDLGGDLTQIAIGAAITVHRALGPGLNEADYEQALHLELEALGIEHEHQAPLPLCYKGEPLDCGYRMDVVISKRLLLELKAVDKLHPMHEAQMLTYLRLSSIPLGLLMNFNTLILRNGIVRRACSMQPASRLYHEAAPSMEFDELSREVLAAALEVQHVLGQGLLRSAYEACLARELQLRGIETQIKLPANLIYRDHLIPSSKELPMIVANSLMVACHCVKELSALQIARDRSLLKAVGVGTGLCINFHAESLGTEIRRIRTRGK